MCKEERGDLVIVLKDINKSFEEKQVLKNVSFYIAPGEKVGIIGKNGAGKTTLLRIMNGTLKPDDGFLRIHYTENPLKNFQVLKDIVCISGTQSQLWKDMRIRDSFDNCIRMYKLPKQGAKERLNKLIEILEVEALLNALPRDLSLGERMRCELVYALLVEAPILMMDEVMIGLDVSVKHKIMTYFETYFKKKECTLIYTGHNLAEVERLCDRILLIDKGKIIYDGSIDRIMREFSPLYQMEIKIGENFPDMEDLPIEWMRIEKDKLYIAYDKKKIDTAQILKHLKKKMVLLDVKLHEPDLESTIKKVYERIK